MFHVLAPVLTMQQWHTTSEEQRMLLLQWFKNVNRGPAVDANVKNSGVTFEQSLG